MVSQSVSISGVGGQNNTMITCQAEQRGQDGHLIYNSSLAVIRLKMTSKLMLKHLDIWSTWEIIIFVLLVVGSLLLLACCGCGMYFCCGTRGDPYTIMSNSAETQTLRSPSAETQTSETQVGLLEPALQINETVIDISTTETRIHRTYAER